MPKLNNAQVFVLRGTHHVKHMTEGKYYLRFPIAPLNDGKSPFYALLVQPEKTKP